MRAEVDLADVVVLENSGVSRIRSVVSRAMVQRAAGRKSQTSIQTIFLDQLPRTILQFLTVREKQDVNSGLVPMSFNIECLQLGLLLSY